MEIMFSKYSLFSMLPKIADALQRGNEHTFVWRCSVVFRLTPVTMQLNISSFCVAISSIDLLFSLLPKFADVCVILPTLVFIMTSLP